MIPLHLEFQDGWTGEHVVVRLDGGIVAEAAPTTRMQIGLAEALVVEVEPGPHVLTVEIADAALAAEHAFDASTETWVGISRVDGTVAFREQQTLFGYV
ncbi:hypothetical protein [Microbacterium hominis]|uniref:Uncharacterized protein n=1 Tax=Microbacterium hominis TaxID=162426 RepID=A0A7D4Q6G6_9MICO|nr:hypothetical protein [Microbacterium hominis]QKJ18179.1 hypothetical protein HQM25_01305 [Microbacterium hominis]